MQLETFEHSQPLTGTVTEQRRKRREVFMRFLADTLKRTLTPTEIAELRSRLRERGQRSKEMVEAENAELRQALMALSYPALER